MDPTACLETFATLLAQEKAALVELNGLLEHEHELLVANDVAALEKAITERQACMGRLVRIEDERRSLCRMLGKPADHSGLEQIMSWCDPRGTLRAKWAECSAQAQRCRELNDRNGALVAVRMKRVEALLSVVTGRPAEVPTYGRDGAYSTNRAGRVLSAEA